MSAAGAVCRNTGSDGGFCLLSGLATGLVDSGKYLKLAERCIVLAVATNNRLFSDDFIVLSLC